MKFTCVLHWNNLAPLYRTSLQLSPHRRISTRSSPSPRRRRIAAASPHPRIKASSCASSFGGALIGGGPDMRLLLCLLWGLAWSQPAPTMQDVLEAACSLGDLKLSLQMATRLTMRKHLLSSSDHAASLHVLSALELVLRADAAAAVRLHLHAKAANASTVPPLAQLHLQGHACGGLGDLFYVSAVIIKQLVDRQPSAVINDASTDFRDVFTEDYRSLLHEAYTTLITLSADSGLHVSAELLLARALANRPDDAALLFRAALLTPGVYESQQHLDDTRALLETRVNDLYARCSPAQAGGGTGSAALSLPTLNEFVLSPTFYFVYMGLSDRALLERLHASYALAHPAIASVLVSPTSRAGDRRGERAALAAGTSGSSSSSKRRIRVGFVSAHFRRHSVCKLFCRLATHLDPSAFHTVLFSSLQETFEDAWTAAIRSEVGEFVRLGKTLAYNRNEVTSRSIDVLIYLDVGMDPSTAMWAASRLAPIQACLWGHPTTTGMAHMDYFISSDGYHRPFVADSFQPRARYFQGELAGPGLSFDASGEDEDALSLAALREAERAARGERESAHAAHEGYSEQLVRLDSLGFYFARPTAALPLDFLAFDASTRGMSYSAHVLAQGPALPAAVVVTSTTLTPALRAAYTHALIHRSDDYYAALGRGLATLDKAPTGQAQSEATTELHSLLDQRRMGAKVLLIPQHAPKLHPSLDKVLHSILRAVPQLLVVVLHPERKQAWRNTLVNRWKRTVGGRLIQRVVWLPALSPDQFTTLLAIGDLMLDPYPFGGGVTTLEALAMCTPVITLPSRQTVPALAAGMLRAMTPTTGAGEPLDTGDVASISGSGGSSSSSSGSGDAYFRSLVEKWLLPVNAKELVWNVLQMMNRNSPNVTAVLPHLREHMCGSVPGADGAGASRVDRVFNDTASVREWGALLQRIAA